MDVSQSANTRAWWCVCTPDLYSIFGPPHPILSLDLFHLYKWCEFNETQSLGIRGPCEGGFLIMPDTIRYGNILYQHRCFGTKYGNKFEQLQVNSRNMWCESVCSIPIISELYIMLAATRMQINQFLHTRMHTHPLHKIKKK